jgi:hypothetical protein
MARPKRRKKNSFAASPSSITRREIRNGVSGLDCEGEPIKRSSATGTGEFDWPADNLAIQSKSQTDLVGTEDSYLCTYDLCRHKIGSADGTRPQPMPTDQNYLAASYFISERHWSTELDPRAQGALIGICQITSPGKCLQKPHTCDFPRSRYHVTILLSIGIVM